MKTIGLFGLTFSSGNKGCSALAYSFLEILSKLNKDEKMKVIVFTEGSDKEIENDNSNIEISILKYRLKDIKSLSNLKKHIKLCDYVFDFTEGDSFSDIYGIKRMIRVSLTKLMTISSKTPLVLGPQTYGPFNSALAKILAKKIIKKSYYVCARDIMSAENMKEMTGITMDSYTDVAFALPKANVDYMLGTGKKIGINISALLWNGGYNSNNQFGLTVDYKKYTTRLIEEIRGKSEFEVHLIPHVISENFQGVENDYKVCKELSEKYEDVIVAPAFETPMEAKKYISEMDVFIGARMHATIGAFSAGVVTIPFSYSPKFEGLYEGVGYKYVIHGKTMRTDEAVDKTMEYIENRSVLSREQQNSMDIINGKLENLYSKVADIIG